MLCQVLSKIIIKKLEKPIDKRKMIWYNNKVVKTDAGMAQSVEHVIGNDEVISSILITSSKENPRKTLWYKDLRGFLCLAHKCVFTCLFGAF